MSRIYRSRTRRSHRSRSSFVGDSCEAGDQHLSSNSTSSGSAHNGRATHLNFGADLSDDSPRWNNRKLSVDEERSSSLKFRACRYRRKRSCSPAIAEMCPVVRLKDMSRCEQSSEGQQNVCKDVQSEPSPKSSGFSGRDSGLRSALKDSCSATSPVDCRYGVNKIDAMRLTLSTLACPSATALDDRGCLKRRRGRPRRFPPAKLSRTNRELTLNRPESPQQCPDTNGSVGHSARFANGSIGGVPVTLRGNVWCDTAEGGLLVVSVKWKGRQFSGTLLDCAIHQWAPSRPVLEAMFDAYKKAPPSRTEIPTGETAVGGRGATCRRGRTRAGRKCLRGRRTAENGLSNADQHRSKTGRVKTRYLTDADKLLDTPLSNLRAAEEDDVCSPLGAHDSDSKRQESYCASPSYNHKELENRAKHCQDNAELSSMNGDKKNSPDHCDSSPRSLSSDLCSGKPQTVLKSGSLSRTVRRDCNLSKSRDIISSWIDMDSENSSNSLLQGDDLKKDDDRYNSPELLEVDSRALSKDKSRSGCRIAELKPPVSTRLLSREISTSTNNSSVSDDDCLVIECASPAPSRTAVLDSPSASSSMHNYSNTSTAVSSVTLPSFSIKPTSEKRQSEGVRTCQSSINSSSMNKHKNHTTVPDLISLSNSTLPYEACRSNNVATTCSFSLLPGYQYPPGFPVPLIINTPSFSEKTSASKSTNSISAGEKCRPLPDGLIVKPAKKTSFELSRESENVGYRSLNSHLRERESITSGSSVINMRNMTPRSRIDSKHKQTKSISTYAISDSCSTIEQTSLRNASSSLLLPKSRVIFRDAVRRESFPDLYENISQSAIKPSSFELPHIQSKFTDGRLIGAHQPASEICRANVELPQTIRRDDGTSPMYPLNMRSLARYRCASNDPIAAAAALTMGVKSPVLLRQIPDNVSVVNNFQLIGGHTTEPHAHSSGDK